MKRTPLLASLFVLICVAVCGQERESRFAELKKLHIPDLAGSVPTFYSPSARERAIAYQKSLEAAHTWFEEQVGVKVPIVLAVLDEETYPKLNGPAWPMCYSDAQTVPGVVVFPSRIEDLIGPQPQAKLAGEAIAYHEDGHIISHSLKIRSGNAFVNEMIATMYGVAYVNSKRPDLLQQDPQTEDSHPRYTSLEDLDYVYDGVGFKNYVWFQGQLLRIANLLVTGQSFPAVIGKLGAEFPMGQTPETLDQIIVHLDRIQPGSKNMLGSLGGPSTLARLTPSPCPKEDGGGSAAQVVIAVRNNSGAPLVVLPPHESSSTIPTTRSSRFTVRPGEALKLPDGRCLVAGSEPALAVIDKQ